MTHKAKKSLGQNFLKSESALRMMCEAGKVGIEDIVVEIGPGKGALTSKLLEKAKKVIAIEKDYALIEILKEKFAYEITSGKLELVEGDCLEFDPSTYKIKSASYKLIANIPYNITGAIIRRFLEEVAKPEVMVLLVQKEVAERIVARDNKESILSLSVKVYGTPKYVMKVSKRFFSPAPKVDSAIIAISNISFGAFKNKDAEITFFKVLKAGFAHKRKVLIRNLEILESREKISNIFESLKIDTKIRPEDIDLSTWLAISGYLTNRI